jgi:hypothetical protein
MVQVYRHSFFNFVVEEEGIEIFIDQISQYYMATYCYRRTLSLGARGIRLLSKALRSAVTFPSSLGDFHCRTTFLPLGLVLSDCMSAEEVAALRNRTSSRRPEASQRTVQMRSMLISSSISFADSRLERDKKLCNEC